MKISSCAQARTAAPSSASRTSPGLKWAGGSILTATGSTACRQASSAFTSSPAPTALRFQRACMKTLEEMKRTMPDGIEYFIALDTNDFVRMSIEEVIRNAVRGGHPGGARGVSLSAELPLHHHLHGRDLRLPDRHVYRHARPGVFHQPAHPVRHRACHRHGR